VDWFNEICLRVSATLRSLRDREEGQALVEYAVLIGLITAALVATIVLLRGDIQSAFDTVESAF
jgi:pilus assembly protein Flp/PilA